ncbi:hypothetical protein D9V86_02025 [Bacteroidetes/Chlorobi group bacterium ChocPot_Mid]|nr:MAG: hypothetical protein D9V86_02025 [Bacteroidetes/Chlorobi group bacterium ChocPot_Mid]
MQGILIVVREGKLALQIFLEFPMIIFQNGEKDTLITLFPFPVFPMRGSLGNMETGKQEVN